jgi:hypothetical protein
VHTLRSRCFTVTASAFMLVCLSALHGCDSKPSDGSQVADGGPVSPEQKAKVKALYAERHKAAAKSNARKR